MPQRSGRLQVAFNLTSVIHDSSHNNYITTAIEFVSCLLFATTTVAVISTTLICASAYYLHFERRQNQTAAGQLQCPIGLTHVLYLMRIY